MASKFRTRRQKKDNDKIALWRRIVFAPILLAFIALALIIEGGLKIWSGIGWSWRQKIQQHWIAIVVVAIGVVVVIALIILAYKFDWTGFNSHTGPKLDQNQQYWPEKTLWDWLQLLIVPLVLAIGGFWLSQVQKSTEQRSTTDNQREAVLQAYIDKISELLLKGHLDERAADGKLKPEYDQVRKIARVRTVTVLAQLDARRVGSIFTFLREAGLISTIPNSSVVSLKDADLRRVKWEWATLWEADLSGANFSEAILRQADLSNADLSGAALNEAKLWGANLSNANLSKATLEKADLSEATLEKATLEKATLRGAILRQAYLTKANFRRARLDGADLSSAHLSRADLSGARLTGAVMSGAHLDKTILKGARYNTRELPPITFSSRKISDKIPPTKWPQGFDPKAAGAIEDGIYP